MSKLTYRISYYALYAMFAIILIVMGLFFFGGDATGAAVIPGVDPEMWQPAQTDALLYLMYALFGIAIAATVIAAVFQFGAALKDNPMGAIKSLLGLVLLVAVVLISYAMGSDATITANEAPYTDTFWLKITDMFIYSIYFLLGIAALATLVNMTGIFKK